MRPVLGGLAPDWPAPPSVQALFTTRERGVSISPFDGFNLGDHVGDTPAAVAHNRAQLARTVGRRPVFLRQVHGTQVCALDTDTPDGAVADAAWTTRRDVAAVVMVADCLPVLLCSADGGQVAAAHAGWRGLAGVGGVGVLETTVAAFDRSQPLLAWLGPCIGPAAFEVGPEVRAAFLDVHAPAEAAFMPSPRPGHYLADLARLARQRLAAQGVDRVFGNDGSLSWCTATGASRFFSHRRDAGRLGSTGRMAACIWRV